MTTLTIDTDDANEIEKLKALAKEQGWLVKISSNTILREAIKNKVTNGTKVMEAMQAFAEKGGFTSFGDASEWQRETRKDKVLFGREED